MVWILVSYFILVSVNFGRKLAIWQGFKNLNFLYHCQLLILLSNDVRVTPSYNCNMELQSGGIVGH
jgi:hypothetical protein